MKRLTTISAAILLAGGVQLAYAQPPGGGGGRGGFGGMNFDALNTDDTPGTANEGEQVLTVDEVGAFIENMMSQFANRGGGPGGGAQQGEAAGGGGPRGGGAAGGRGRGGGFDPATIFANWDTNGDGEVTQTEFDARPQGGRGGGRAGGGGGRAGGPPQ